MNRDEVYNLPEELHPINKIDEMFGIRTVHTYVEYSHFLCGVKRRSRERSSSSAEQITCRSCLGVMFENSRHTLEQSRINRALVDDQFIKRHRDLAERLGRKP